MKYAVAVWQWLTGAVSVRHPVWRLSLTKLLALLFGATDCAVMLLGTINAYTITLAIACLAAAMGKEPFTAFLGKWSSTTNITDTQSNARSDARNLTVNDAHTINETVTRTIQERRDVGAGFEATP